MGLFSYSGRKIDPDAVSRYNYSQGHAVSCGPVILTDGPSDRGCAPVIDLHIHILPGIDDGPRTLEESLEMARMAVADGITTVVATPHLFSHRAVALEDFNAPDTIREAVAALNRELAAAAIPLIVLPGCEVPLFADILKFVESNRVLSLNDGGRYISLEMPDTVIPPATEDIIFHLSSLGLTPIITHPERNPIFYEMPQKLKRLLSLGCLAQITARSLTGGFGWRAFDGTHDGQIFALGIHISADALILTGEGGGFDFIDLWVHVIGVIVADRFHHAANGALHEQGIIYGLVDVLRMNEIPRFPEGDEEVLQFLRGDVRLPFLGGGGGGRQENVGGRVGVEPREEIRFSQNVAGDKAAGKRTAQQDERRKDAKNGFGCFVHKSLR